MSHLSCHHGTGTTWIGGWAEGVSEQVIIALYWLQQNGFYWQKSVYSVKWCLQCLLEDWKWLLVTLWNKQHSRFQTLLRILRLFKTKNWLYVEQIHPFCCPIWPGAGHKWAIDWCALHRRLFSINDFHFRTVQVERRHWRVGGKLMA